MLRKTILSLFLAIAFLVSALSFAATDTAAKDTRIDGVIAVVNDDVILESELERRVSSIEMQLKQKGTSLPEKDILKKQVLERLIVDSIQLQMAERAGVRISDEQVNTIVGKMAAENKMSREAFRNNLKRSGINYNLFLADLRSEMMINQARQAQVARRIFVSEQEINDLVKLIDEQGAEQKQFHLGHIMVAVPETAQRADIDAAREKAEKIISKLRRGADFAKTAVADSDGQDSLSGGDFGWKTINQMPTLFVGTVKQLKKNQISEPIRSPSGFHILKLIDSRGDQRHIVSQTKSRHILLTPSAIMSEKKAKEKLNDFRQQILKGADFADLARKHSDDLGSANGGGELGWNNSDVFAPEFRDTLEKLKKNEISRPFRTEFGWHIVQLQDRRTDDQTLDMKKMRATRILQNRKFNEEVETWMREIRERAYVKIIDQDLAG